MPVKVVERTVKGKKKWSVVETDTGKTKKSYDSEKDAQAYATALNMAHARKKGYIPKKRSKG